MSRDLLLPDPPHSHSLRAPCGHAGETRCACCGWRRTRYPLCSIATVITAVVVATVVVIHVGVVPMLVEAGWAVLRRGLVVVVVPPFHVVGLYTQQHITSAF